MCGYAPIVNISFYFSAYIGMFMRHLCEPEVPNTEYFADGVPKNSIPRQNILTRIGMLRLIKNKVSIITILCVHLYFIHL